MRCEQLILSDEYSDIHEWVQCDIEAELEITVLDEKSQDTYPICIPCLNDLLETDAEIIHRSLEIKCIKCGDPLLYYTIERTTLVADDEANCIVREYYCKYNHLTLLSIQNSERRKCFCHDYEKLKQWPDIPKRESN